MLSFFFSIPLMIGMNFKTSKLNFFLLAGRALEVDFHNTLCTLSQASRSVGGRYSSIRVWENENHHDSHAGL
jgi:hypothetical protein